MRTFLRLIAMLSLLSVLATALFMLLFVPRGLQPLLATGAFGIATVVGWLVTFVAGPIATVQLLRLKHSGRIAGSLLFGYMFLYYSVGMFIFREPGVALGPLIGLSAFLLLLVVVLLSPAAKNVCVVEAIGKRLQGPS